MIIDKYIVDTIYTLVDNTGLFHDYCEIWYNRPRDKKTWSNFQAHFQAAQRKFKTKKKVSTRSGGYHVANNLREMDGTHDAIVNLVTTAAANRDTMISQCKTIADLTATVSALTQQLQQVNAVNNRGP